MKTHLKKIKGRFENFWNYIQNDDIERKLVQLCSSHSSIFELSEIPHIMTFTLLSLSIPLTSDIHTINVKVFTQEVIKEMKGIIINKCFWHGKILKKLVFHVMFNVIGWLTNISVFQILSVAEHHNFYGGKTVCKKIQKIAWWRSNLRNFETKKT